MHTRKNTAAKNTPLAPLKGGMIHALSFVTLLVFAQNVAAQNADSVFTKIIEVDQIPRSAYARTPSVVVDDDDNFTVAWSAERNGRPEIYLRRFDAIGRPLTDIRALSEFVGDSLNIENPQLAYVGNGFLWLVWQQTRLRAASEVVGMILTPDLKIARTPFSIHVDNDSYTRPRIVADPNGRVLVAWLIETLPTYTAARIFRPDGTPLTGMFHVSQDTQAFRVGEHLAVAVSKAGMFAVAWHAYEPNADLIYVRLFPDDGKFTSDPVAIAQNSVFYPSVTFGSANEVVAQWFTTQPGPVLRAQRFDLGLKPLAGAFDISTGLDREPRPALVSANERGAFNSYWSVTEQKDALLSNVFTRTFLMNEQPVNAPQLIARPPQRTNFPTELETGFALSGNYVTVYTGNDTALASASPRVSAIIKKAALPDLYVFDLAITPLEPTRADSVFAEFKVRNVGFAPAPSSAMLLELTSNVIEARLATVPPLGVEQTRAFKFNLGTLPPHSYTYRVKLDDPLEVPEVDEKNNGAAQLFKVVEAPTLAVDPPALEFAATFGQPNPLTQSFIIKNSGKGVLHWAITSDQSWVSVTPDTGSIDSISQTVSVAVDIAGLAAGVHPASLAVNSNGGRATVQITLTIAAPLPSLSYGPALLRFAGTQGGANPPEQVLVIRNAGSGILTTKLTSNQPWLLLRRDTTATTLTDSVGVAIALGNLSAGTYTATITINSNGGNGAVNVILDISPQPPLLDVSPRTLNFVATEGTANPPAQPIAIRNIGGGTLQWSVREDVFWLSFNPSSGSTTTEVDYIEVIASISRLPAGNYSATFLVDSSPGGTVEVRVNFVVNPRPRLPDLVVLTQQRGLINCFASDYGLVTEFVVQNLGEAAAGPSVAQLSINNEVRQRLNLPALDTLASFSVRFNTESLPSGPNRISCEVGVGATFQESTNSNNITQFTEWVPRRGDANLDSLLNLQDLFYLVDLILERGPAEPTRREIWAANVSIDSTLDIADITNFIDVVLNQGRAESLAMGGELALQLTPAAGGRTRIGWSSASPLRAWQATWKLPNASRDLPLQTMQRAGYEVDWKISQRELQLLVWQTGEARAPAAPHHDFELPFTLTQDGLAQIIGMTGEGAMVQLTPTPVATELPKTFRLSPAYPNPWRKVAQQKILWRYELPEFTEAEMRIYNLLGQEVRRLQLGLVPAGRGEISWDGRDRSGAAVAQGIYFVELIAGKLKQRERLVVF